MSSPGFLPDTIDGRKITQEQSDRLHFLRNRPEPPLIDGEPLTFPPYAYRPYPCAMYHVWTDEGKRRALIEAARAYGLNLKEPLQREEAESRVPGYDSKLVQTQTEHDALIAIGWSDSPDDVAARQDAYLANVVAVAAAERAYTDRRMSASAQAEFHAADAAQGEDHLLDLPVPRADRRKGRPVLPRQTEGGA